MVPSAPSSQQYENIVLSSNLRMPAKFEVDRIRESGVKCEWKFDHVFPVSDGASSTMVADMIIIIVLSSGLRMCAKFRSNRISEWVK